MRPRFSYTAKTCLQNTEAERTRSVRHCEVKMSKRQLNLLSFVKKKEDSHNVSKRARMELATHEQQVQQDAAASQVHRQLEEQEVGTSSAAAVAAASQIHRQPEQELVTLAAAGHFQQQEEDVHRKSDSEGEESDLSGEESGTGCTTIWTTAG